MDDTDGSRPDISIVVPTRDRAQLLTRLLRQLVALEGPPTYEVLVIDEGSSDSTPAVLDHFAAAHGVRRIRHDDPVGLPAARNVGIAATTGRYVAWIDDDDLTSPDRLRRQLDALQAGAARWSCSARVDIDDDLAVVGCYACPPPERLLEQLLGSNVLPTSAQGLLVERALLDEVAAGDTAGRGPFVETLRSAEDWELCIRLAAAAPAHMLDEPLVGYRVGAVSMSTDTARMEVAIRTVIDTHAPLYARTGARPDWATIHDSLLTADLRRGRRHAVSRAARSFLAGPSVRRAYRVAASGLAPAWYARRSSGRRDGQVPARWRTIARSWLDRVVTGPLIPDGPLAGER